MAASYLEASLDRLGAPMQRDDTIEICINPDGQVWGEFQGDHFMRGLGTPLTQTEIKDLGNQIASAASTTLSTKKPIVSVSILYRDRPIRAQVIQPPAVDAAHEHAAVTAKERSEAAREAMATSEGVSVTGQTSVAPVTSVLGPLVTAFGFISWEMVVVRTTK